jgi:hypothetical protein
LSEGERVDTSQVRGWRCRGVWPISLGEGVIDLGERAQGGGGGGQAGLLETACLTFGGRRSNTSECVLAAAVVTKDMDTVAGDMCHLTLP